MRKWTIIGSVIALTGVFAVNGVARASNTQSSVQRGGVVYTKGHGTGASVAVDAGAQRARTNGIYYHGGPVLLSTVNLYYIFYGNLSTTQKSILTTFAGNLGPSPYWNINSTYYNRAGAHISNALHYGGAATDNYSQGKTFDDNGITNIVSRAIGSGPGKLPLDPNGVYLVVTAPDVVDNTGLYTQYCGWHTNGTINGKDIKYGLVGVPAGNDLNACAWQTTSPNGDAGADAATSIIAHEAEETTTDPDLNAWYDRLGNENGDKCAWTFGTTSLTASGAEYNFTVGANHYLIQQNWLNASGGRCVMRY